VGGGWGRVRSAIFNIALIPLGFIGNQELMGHVCLKCFIPVFVLKYK